MMDCPMAFNGTQSQRCREENCGWWSKQYKECCVQSLPDIARYLSEIANR